MGLVLKNGRAFIDEKLEKLDIAVENGKIKSIGDNLSADETIDCTGKIIIPGIIDAHVHFRTPGFEHKEEWDTGSSAAVSGGVTTVLDMPNTKPPTTTRKVLGEKRIIAKSESLCNFGFHFGASNLGEVETVENIPSLKVCTASDMGDISVTDRNKLKKIFTTAKKRNLIVSVHAEDDETIRKNILAAKKKGWNSVEYHNRIRGREAEIKAVEGVLELQSEVGNKLHFCHITTKDSVELIEEAKKSGNTITCEVTPHHLFLSTDDLRRLGNLGKVNPPLREKEDVEALWWALMKGVIDCIGTDHAPHTLEEKQKGYWDAPSGMPGVENSLPLLLNAVNSSKLSLGKVAELMSENPAKIFALNSKGIIKEGYDADLTVIDLEKRKTVRNEEQHTKCRWSPYNGWELTGWPVMTIVKGQTAFIGERVNGAVRGEEVLVDL
jgi:dihydroorotase